MIKRPYQLFWGIGKRHWKMDQTIFLILKRGAKFANNNNRASLKTRTFDVVCLKILESTPFEESHLRFLFSYLTQKNAICNQMLYGNSSFLFWRKIFQKFLNLDSPRDRSSCREVFLEIPQNSQENTCTRVSFFNKVAGGACNFIKKRDSGTGVFLWILRNF